MDAVKCMLVAAGLLAVGSLAPGCRWPWEPEVGPMVGVVRYPGGAPVYMAKVWVVDGRTTFSDRLGHYRLAVRAESGDTVTVVATDGYTPGISYGETRSGSLRVVVHASAVVADVVLDHSSPI